MNYYPFHLGDYAAHTGHLEAMEDLAYRRLLDLYYLREEALPVDVQATAKLVRMRSYAADVESVLNEFFTLTDAGWAHERCDEEISKMQDKQAKARKSAAASVNARRANAERSLQEQQTDAERSLAQTQADVELPTPTPTPNSSEGKPSGGKPPADQSKSELWKSAVSLLSGQGMPETQARSFVGKLAKDYPEGEIVLDAVRGAVTEQPADARAYLIATCKHLNGERKRGGGTDWTGAAI
ncbi:YdaU family protein [Hydrogenophaga aromaticivorans]|uniref:DUF1376 domain-containing protein n=1 Tax=Hydrogenophaga aromaticivorans TaxID=2610898 RepID=UPI001B382D36|nr:YdaU family protein [Hydrogenophaga aromaticivorans]